MTTDAEKKTDYIRNYMKNYMREYRKNPDFIEKNKAYTKEYFKDPVNKKRIYDKQKEYRKHNVSTYNKMKIKIASQQELIEKIESQLKLITIDFDSKGNILEKLQDLLFEIDSKRNI